MTSATETRPATRHTLRRGFRVVARGFADQKKILAIGVLGSALYGVMTVLTARVIAHLVSSVITPAVEAQHITGSQVWTIVWQMTVAVLLTVVGVILRRVAAGIAYFNLNAMYRQRVTRQYLRLPLAWHHRHPSGQLLSNANADVEATWNVFQPLPMAIGVVVMLLVGAVEMFRVDLALALVGMTVFPALFIANMAFQSRMSPRVTRAQQLRAEVSEVAHESLEAGLLVKAMGREEQETARFATVTHELREAAVDVGRTRGTFDPVIEAIPTLGTLAVLGIGTARVASGHIEAADVVQIAYLFSVLAFPVRAFGWVLAELPRSAVGWDRVHGVLSAKGEMAYGDRDLPRDGAGATGLTSVSYAYEIGQRGDLADEGSGAAVTQDIEQSTAVDDVTIDVPAGLTTALVGPTGSGKSTLTNLVLRLVDPDRGTVEIDGQDLRGVRGGGVPEVATLVAQQTFLFDDTVRGNVTLGKDVDDEAVQEALQVAQADGFVSELSNGADTRVGERGASLSGGQRQRIALARAVIRQPRLLVLDDATSAVDPGVETAILDALRERSQGITVLVVAYRMSTIGMADRVAYLEDGRLLDQGTHAELLERCVGYERLVTAYSREADERAAVAAGEQA